jgi:23S rRNA pseudouridine1911/1915/1917 synthase
MQELSILYEDAAILIINKPALLAVQTESNEDSLETVLKQKYPFVGIVHRLDQRVSGLVLVAKTEISLEKLNKIFQERQVSKKYLAIVQGKPEEESKTLEHWIQKSKTGNKVKAFNKEVADSKKAILTYQVIKSSNRYSLLEIDLETGRFHQIRAQMTALGFPIVGDLKYGYPRNTSDGSIFLHAYQLEFPHPDSHKICNFTIEKPILWSKFGFE